MEGSSPDVGALAALCQRHGAPFCWMRPMPSVFWAPAGAGWAMGSMG